jgi:hypothetical protein
MWLYQCDNDHEEAEQELYNQESEVMLGGTHPSEEVFGVHYFYS